MLQYEDSNTDFLSEDLPKLLKKSQVFRTRLVVELYLPKFKVITICFRLKRPLSGLRQFLANESSLEIKKNASCFTLETSFAPKMVKLLFKFFWSCRKTAEFNLHLSYS